MLPNTYNSVANRSGEHFRELANYSAAPVRIQGKAEVSSRQGEPFHVVPYGRFAALSNDHPLCCNLQKLAENCNSKGI